MPHDLHDGVFSGWISRRADVDDVCLLVHCLTPLNFGGEPGRRRDQSSQTLAVGWRDQHDPCGNEPTAGKMHAARCEPASLTFATPIRSLVPEAAAALVATSHEIFPERTSREFRSSKAPPGSLVVLAPA